MARGTEWRGLSGLGATHQKARGMPRGHFDSVAPPMPFSIIQNYSEQDQTMSIFRVGQSQRARRSVGRVGAGVIYMPGAGRAVSGPMRGLRLLC